MAIAHLCDLEAYLPKNASGIISYREWRNAGTITAGAEVNTDKPARSLIR